MSRGGVFLAAALAVLLAVGCGSSGSDEISVQTGSLSKAEFIEKADAICKAARTEFVAKYTSFLESKKDILTSGDAQAGETLRNELIESLLAPNAEGQITRISELGAPASYAPKAASFLKALQESVEEIQENPAILGKTPFPFKKAEDTAKQVGMKGCAESFS